MELLSEPLGQMQGWGVAVPQKWRRQKGPHEYVAMFGCALMVIAIAVAALATAAVYTLGK